jgi:hypothetical protein
MAGTSSHEYKLSILRGRPNERKIVEKLPGGGLGRSIDPEWNLE